MPVFSSHRFPIPAPWLVAALLIGGANTLQIAYSPAACASIGQSTATLQATPDIIMADGRSATTITVTLDDGSGHTVPDGTQVHFTTTSGTVDPMVATATSGVVRTTLTSSSIAGVAHVTASYISSNGAASGTTTVEFTADSALADTDQVVANWIRVSSPGYLAYGADSRIIDAATPKRGVHIAYRGMTIDANSAQIDLDGDVVRAQQAIIKHGSKTPLQVDSLIYYLDSQAGTAMIANAPGQHRVQQVSINGATMTTTPLTKDATAERTDYDFQDLSSGHVLITATSASVQPHSQIQLARAAIFIDNKHIVSMPNQVMPLNTNQVFGQQVLGYGTTGLFVDVPYYASLTPTSAGTFSLRSQAASVQDGTYYQGRGLFALDYDRTYSDSVGNRTGDFKIIGLSDPGNLGLRWNQSERLRGGTQSYLYLDAPGHKSVYGSVNLRHDYRAFAMNLSATSNQPLLGGSSQTISSRTAAANLVTPNHRLLGNRAFGLNYNEIASYSFSAQRYNYGSSKISSSSIVRSVGVNLNTNPYMPNKQTTISDNVEIAQSYQQVNNFSAVNVTANVQMNSRLRPGATTSLSYSYTHYPQFNATNIVPITQNNRLLAVYNSSDRQNITWGFNAAPPSNLWNLNLDATYGLPTEDTSLTSALNYRLSSQMHLGITNYYTALSGYAYHDWQFSVAHRIGQRDLVVSWSALEHNFQVNLAEAQF